MGCIFKRTQLRESLGSSLRNPEGAAECVCLQHLSDEYKTIYIAVGCDETREGSIKSCCIKESYRIQASDRFYAKK